MTSGERAERRRWLKIKDMQREGNDMLRQRDLWDSWMAQPELEAALVRHEIRTSDRFVPVTLALRGAGGGCPTATSFARTGRAGRRLN